MQARQPKRDSRFEACSALKAPPVKTSADRRRPAVPIEPRKSAQRSAKRNRRLRWSQDRRSELPRFGMSTKPNIAARIRQLRQKAIEIRAPVVMVDVGEMQLAACIHLQAPGIAKDGFSYRPAASIPPRPRLARSLRAGGRARFEPHAGQRQILHLLPRDSAVGGHSGRARPAAARNGAPIRRNAVRRRGPFSGSRKRPAPAAAPSSQKPRPQRCGSCERCSGLEVRRPNRSKICPPKSVRVLLRCSDPTLTEALSRQRRGFLSFAAHESGLRSI